MCVNAANPTVGLCPELLADQSDRKQKQETNWKQDSAIPLISLDTADVDLRFELTPIRKYDMGQHNPVASHVEL